MNKQAIIKQWLQEHYLAYQSKNGEYFIESGFVKESQIDEEIDKLIQLLDPLYFTINL